MDPAGLLVRNTNKGKRNSPSIKKDGFYGTVDELRKFAEIFIQKLNSTSEKDCFTINEEY